MKSWALLYLNDTIQDEWLMRAILTHEILEDVPSTQTA